jgi:hypothetical protein
MTGSPRNEVTNYVNPSGTASNTLTSVDSDRYQDMTGSPCNEVTNYVNPNGTAANTLTSLWLVQTSARW